MNADRLLAALPEADFDTCARLEATTRGGDVPLDIRAEAVALGGITIAFDDRFGATLAWVLPDAEVLLLELRSVESAFERTTWSVWTPASELPEFADVQLIERTRGAAARIDGDAMRMLLGRVRAAMEAAGDAQWQPRGELVRGRGNLAEARRVAPLGVMRRVAGEHGLHASPSANGDGVLVAPRWYNGGDTKDAAMLRGVVYGGLGGVALGMVLAFTVAAILGTPTWARGGPVEPTRFVGTLTAGHCQNHDEEGEEQSRQDRHCR